MPAVLMRRIGSVAACLFLAACVLAAAGASFYLPFPLPPGAALAIAAAAGLAAGGAAPRRVVGWSAGAILAAPVWGAFAFWLAASSPGLKVLPFLAYPLAATVGVVAGLIAWRWPRRRSAWRLLPLAAGAAIVAALSFLPGAIRTWATAAAPAPRFSLPLLRGGTLDSRAFQGKTVVLAFWASWCEPCKKELPHLQQVSRRYAGDPSVRFYLIDVGLGGETPARGRRFLRRHGIHLPSAFDGSGTVSARFHTRGMLPYRVMIGPQERVRYRSFGYSPRDAGFHALRKAIEEASR